MAALKPRTAAAALSGALLLWAGACAAGDAGPAERYARLADKPFEDVVLDLQFIVSRHNFAVTGRHRLGEAIRARGEEPDHPDAMVISFCNVELARQAIAIDPALMAYMPCKASLLQRPDGVLVQTLLLPAATGREDFDAFARRVNGILREIVDYTASTGEAADGR